MSLEAVKPLLINYVNINCNVQSLDWEQHLSTKLLFDPYARSYSAKKKITHYFLQVAAISETELIRKADFSRALMIHIHNSLGNDCFKQGKLDSFEEQVNNWNLYNRLGPSKNEIPKVLTSINRFVQNIAKGDLIEYAKKFAKPKEFVNNISDNIPRMQGLHIEKAWLYMRWMTRPLPDLNIFTNFSPQDLYIPMTSYIRNVTYCLGLSPETNGDWWNDYTKVEQIRQRVTKFAQELFPEDPIKVDYPFYMLGRWIHGKELTLQLLVDYLQFCQQIFEEIKCPPVSFDVAALEDSTFEAKVRADLTKFEVMFQFTPYALQLKNDEGAPKYTPDFVLSQYKRKGKTIILEPHGIWTPKTKRWINLGHKRFYIWTRPIKINLDERQFVSKLKEFRKIWGKMYYLILIVPPQFKERIEESYHDVYDEIYEGKDIPKLLYNLRT
jgi:hypothetical protein